MRTCKWLRRYSRAMNTAAYVRSVGLGTFRVQCRNATYAILRVFLWPLRWFILEVTHRESYMWGAPGRVHVDRTCKMVDTLYNTSSGDVTVGEYSFAGHGVCLITGAHDARLLMKERMRQYPTAGGDIFVGKGVWIGSRAVILGPCRIGDNAVVAAGAVVVPGTEIPAGSVVAGVPARLVRSIDEIRHNEPGRVGHENAS